MILNKFMDAYVYQARLAMIEFEKKGGGGKLNKFFSLQEKIKRQTCFVTSQKFSIRLIATLKRILRP